MFADEAFMTATPFCILPVTRFNHNNISDGKMGPVTRKLLDTWSDNVGVDIEKQIKSYANDANSNAPTPYEFKK
jgi:branched-chain amino acid aminotransferase